MDIIWSKEVDDILSVGYYLDDIGIRNWALSEVEALVAIERLSEINMPILGGAVLIKENGRLKANYDSWYCIQRNSESKNSFLVRSISESRKYIDDYNINQQVYFVLTTDC